MSNTISGDDDVINVVTVWFLQIFLFIVDGDVKYHIKVQFVTPLSGVCITKKISMEKSIWSYIFLVKLINKFSKGMLENLG